MVAGVLLYRKTPRGDRGVEDVGRSVVRDVRAELPVVVRTAEKYDAEDNRREPGEPPPARRKGPGTERDDDNDRLRCRKERPGHQSPSAHWPNTGMYRDSAYQEFSRLRHIPPPMRVNAHTMHTMTEIGWKSGQEELSAPLKKYELCDALGSGSLLAFVGAASYPNMGLSLCAFIKTVYINLRKVKNTRTQKSPPFGGFSFEGDV